MAKKKRTDLMGASAPAPATVKAPTIGIGAATAKDCVALYHVLIRYFEDMAHFYPPPVENPTLAWGLGIIMKGGVVIAKDMETGEIVGSVGVEVGHFPWAPSIAYLNGLWFYVAPERRKGGVANMLMKAAKDIAILNKMSLRLDSISGIEPELQDRYRKIHGFKYVGGNHVWFPESS
jgi:GNAT superfamily N-acetyltransferase